MIIGSLCYPHWTEPRWTKSGSVWFSWENWFSFDSVNGVTTGTVNPISKMWFSIRTTTSSRPIARTRGNGTHLTSIQRIWANHIETWVRFPSPAPSSFQPIKTGVWLIFKLQKHPSAKISAKTSVCFRGVLACHWCPFLEWKQSPASVLEQAWREA